MEPRNRSEPNDLATRHNGIKTSRFFHGVHPLTCLKLKTQIRFQVKCPLPSLFPRLLEFTSGSCWSASP
ncbi:hypothetical protein RJT34_09408 [Clitoria ternatea]|uniref:Uncharacterized protein n=1 Tax=Clitoria ternatea TaxID=43366 RepID=A0AAN9K6X5_CLITE